MGSRRVGHDSATSLSLFTFMHWKRQWQPTPVFLPGESQGWGKAAVYGVAQSRTRLKRLSSSNGSHFHGVHQVCEQASFSTGFQKSMTSYLNCLQNVPHPSIDCVFLLFTSMLQFEQVPVEYFVIVNSSRMDTLLKSIEVQLIYSAVLISAAQQSDLHMYSLCVFGFILFSIVVYHRILNIVPCAIQQDFVYPKVDMLFHIPLSLCDYSRSALWDYSSGQGSEAFYSKGEWPGVVSTHP